MYLSGKNVWMCIYNPLLDVLVLFILAVNTTLPALYLLPTEKMSSSAAVTGAVVTVVGMLLITGIAIVVVIAIVLR